MAAVSTAEGEATRQRILQTALPLFANLGYAGASIRKLAAAANCNVATIAYHFGDKRGLYDTVVQRLHHNLQEKLSERPPLNGSPHELVEGLMQAGWEFCVSHRDHIRLLMRNVIDTGALPEVVQDRWTDELLSQAAAMLQPFRPDWSQPKLRMLVLTLQHSIVRLAIEDPNHLAGILGVAPEQVDETVVSSLTDFMTRELGI